MGVIFFMSPYISKYMYCKPTVFVSYHYTQYKAIQQGPIK